MIAISKVTMVDESEFCVGKHWREEVFSKEIAGGKCNKCCIGTADMAGEEYRKCKEMDEDGYTGCNEREGEENVIKSMVWDGVFLRAMLGNGRSLLYPLHVIRRLEMVGF